MLPAVHLLLFFFLVLFSIALPCPLFDKGTPRKIWAMEPHSKLALLLGLAATATGSIFSRYSNETMDNENVPYPDYARLLKCPGYNAVNVNKFDYGVRADLVLAGEPCNVYGEDLETLSLELTAETREYPERLLMRVPCRQVN
jgi:hypothetical protein